MLPSLLYSWGLITFFLSTTTLITTGFGFHGRHNTPPVFDFKREWIIPSNEPVGTRITTVRTKDQDRDTITYGIEPALFLDGSKYFTINSKTGDVFLKESLAQQTGHDYYLYITANDGHQTAKIEVFVRIPSDANAQDALPIHRGLPFGGSRPYPAFNLPISPSRPTNTFFFPPVNNYPQSSSTSSSKPEKVSTKLVSTSESTTRQIEQDTKLNSSTSSSTTSSPESTSINNESKKSEIEFINNNSIEAQRSKEKERENKDSDQTNHKVDFITAFLPLLAAIAFAPIVGIVFFLLNRKCNKDKEKIMKSLSQKKSISSMESQETCISSGATDLSYKAVLFNSLSSSPSAPILEIGQNRDKDIKWEFPRHHLRFIGILGEGCFGQVWKCEAIDICNTEGPQIVAVKTLKENANEKEKKDLASEIEIMKTLDTHPNVITLLGCCTEKDPMFLIMDFLQFGKLQSYLRESRSERFYGNLLGSLTSRDLTSFAYQVAKGMDYLSSKGIIHRDLAARNILVGNNKTCKIGDFGFARDVVGNNVYERKSDGRLPIRWMAVESLFDNIFTTKSDVWSFGILMWEVVTLGSTPYPGLGASEVMKKIREGYRLEKPEHCKREMYNIMFYCWDENPKERPSFTELVDMLDKLLLSENDYIELDRFPDHSYYNIISNLSGEKL